MYALKYDSGIHWIREIDTVLRVYIANIYFYYSIERFPSRNGCKVTNLKHEHRISTAQCAVLAQHQ